MTQNPVNVSAAGLTAETVFTDFRHLSNVEKAAFLQLLAFWRDLRLPDDDANLYEIAKDLTLEAGLPYIDPRTGETTNP